MKVVTKLTVALFGASVLVMGINGWLRFRREVRFFEAARVRDHEMIGRSVAATAVAVWKSDGREPALQTVAVVNEHFTRIQIRWRESEPWACAATSGTSPTTCVVRDASEPKWFTYVPVDVAGVRRGAIELSESATTEHIFTHEVWVETLETALALALLHVCPRTLEMRYDEA